MHVRWFADIEAKCKEAEELAKAIRDKKDEVKRSRTVSSEDFVVWVRRFWKIDSID